MNVGTRLVELWIAVILVTRALVQVPFGLALLAFAGWIVWRAGSYWFADLFSAYLAYLGCAFIFGPLVAFAGAPMPKDRSTREALRRSGMLGGS